MKKLWLDTETLGLDSKVHKLVQIAALYDPGNGSECLEFQGKCFWDDAGQVSALALATNKYFESKKEDLLTPPQLAENFLRFLTTARDANSGFKLTLCGHNVGFDLGFIDAFYKLANIDGIKEFFDYHTLDTVTVGNILKDLNLMEYRQSLSLGKLCERFQVTLENAHDALSDIKATRLLYHKMLFVLRQH